MKHILLLGGTGYLGAPLASTLLKNEYVVTIIGRTSSIAIPGAKMIKNDVRHLKLETFKNQDIVIDLAAINPNVECEKNPSYTKEVNVDSRIKNSLLAKESGVSTYILISTASVYGHTQKICDETALAHAVNLYTKTTKDAETGVQNNASDNFHTVLLRMSSLFGNSKRMRYDILINRMVYSLFKDGHITLSDGSQRRPILHVNDAARAITSVCETQPTKVSTVFNIGSANQNYTLIDLAKKVCDILHMEPKIIVDKTKRDPLSYFIDASLFAKTYAFTPETSLDQGVKEIWKTLSNTSL